MAVGPVKFDIFLKPYREKLHIFPRELAWSLAIMIFILMNLGKITSGFFFNNETSIA